VYAHSFQSGTFLAKCELDCVGKKFFLIVVKCVCSTHIAKLAIKRKTSKLNKANFNSRVAVIEEWVISNLFMLQISGMSQLEARGPGPGGIAVIQTQVCSRQQLLCTLYVQIPAVAGWQDVYVSAKGGVGIVEVSRGQST